MHLKSVVGMRRHDQVVACFLFSNLGVGFALNSLVRVSLWLYSPVEEDSYENSEEEKCVIIFVSFQSLRTLEKC